MAGETNHSSELHSTGEHSVVNNVAHHEAGIESLLWPTISFSLYLAVMFTFYVKKGKPALLARKASYLQKAEEGNRLLDRAKRRLDHAEERKLNLAQALTAIQQNSKEEGENVASSLLIDANNRASYLVEDAKVRIIQEEKQAEEEIKREIAVRAIALAKSKFEKGWNSDADKRFISNNLQNIKH